MRPWDQGSRLSHLVQELIFPIEYGWFQVQSFVKYSWNTYFDLSDAAKENAQLKQKLGVLETRIMDYEHQVQEVKRLRKLIGFSQLYSRGMMVAEVVGTSTDTPFQGMRIAKGSMDRVKVGMPIVAAQGIVGRVLRAGFKFSDVQLLVDTNFNLDVIVERTRIRGVLHGMADNRCRLKLHRRADIRIGDTIVTSGITGSFPKGLPIGRVMRISYEADNVSQVITIQPWVDYHGLEEVVVLNHTDEEVETIKETAGSDWIRYPPMKDEG